MLTFNPTDFLKNVAKLPEEYDGPSASTLIEVYRDGITAKSSRGTVSHDSDTPATHDNTFEIGSQTKMMTATVLLQLVAEGKISLEDKLADVMDVTPYAAIENIEKVTLEQLLTHSSGLHDYLNDNTVIPAQIMARLQEDPPRPTDSHDFLEMLMELNPPAAFEPGTQTKYSNTGFLFLGLAIEAVTGKSYAENLQTRIFDPAGMSSTTVPGYDRPEGLLSSYIVDGQGGLDVTQLPLNEFGDAGVTSTTGDMIRFMKALGIDQTLVPESQMDALQRYFMATGFDGEFVGHAGGTIGTMSGTYLHIPSGTIFTSVDPVRGPSNYRDLFGEVLNDVATDPVWQTFQQGDEEMTLVATAAHVTLEQGQGTDGAPQTLLNMPTPMGEVSVALPGALGTADLDRIKFSDGSVLVVADAAGSQISLRNAANGARLADNQIIGQGGDDDLTGGRGDDKIIGGSGNDRLAGLRGDDTLDGGAGHDRLFGHRGDDRLDGGAGNDRLIGGRGNDTLDGGSGTDVLRGGRGDDLLQGGAGGDDLRGDRGQDLLHGGGGDDRLNGGRGQDSLHGGAGDDIIKGGHGRDQLFGDGGDDILIGGRGADALQGGLGDDILKGGRNGDDLSGGAGDDILFGGRGNDTLSGGSGDDILNGGKGADTFVFAEDSGDDIITRFDAGRDKIDLTALNLTFEDLVITTDPDGYTEVSFGDATVSIEATSTALVADDFLF